MLDEALEEMAALHVSGATTAAERENFELVLKFHEPLRALVSELEHVAAAATLGTAPRGRAKVSPGLKTRLLEAIAQRAQTQREGLVVTDAIGLVQWINPAFTEMCGYTAEEVRGRKLGPILQGELTNRDAAERMREAVHTLRPCTEELVNYAKDGRPYWVQIELMPIFDPRGQARWIVGRERELERLVA